MRAALDGIRGRSPAQPSVDPPTDPTLTGEDRRIVEHVRPFTMTGQARVLAVIDAVRYCVGNELPGAFAECGVWRGGSVLAMILTLQDLGHNDRDIYLYDTFEGMTAPTEHDVSTVEPPALETWEEAGRRRTRPWPELFHDELVNERAVSETVLSTGYPADRIHLIRGPVEETLPREAPPQLALLRLDTDWYESTRHELRHLYPRLSDAGVLIIDDYGHWEGCRRAVDEYFYQHGPAPFLSRIDYTARLSIKT